MDTDSVQIYRLGRYLTWTLAEFIGFFFIRLGFVFLFGWLSDFEKIFGWLLFGFFKIEIIFVCEMIGCFIFNKNIRLEIFGYYFFVKNVRLDFIRFSVKTQKMFGWTLFGFPLKHKKCSVEV